MRALFQKEQEEKMHRIMKSTMRITKVEEDRQFAGKELRKIYSEEMARMMSSKKNFMLFQKNQEKIDSLSQIKATSKLQKLHTLQQRSIERRRKLLNDRVKVYKLKEKTWFLKTEAIKDSVKRQQQSMVSVATQYRKKAEKQLDLRRTQQKKFMKQFSQKHHTLYNSNLNTQRQKSSSSESFDQSRLQQLVKKRKNRLSSLRKSKNIEQSIQKHKSKEKLLTQSKEKQNFDKLMNKLQKIEKVQIKKNQNLTASSIEKAKSKLYQKVYKNVKTQVGPTCNKHETHQQHFKGNLSKLRSRSVSPIDKSNFQDAVTKSRMTKREDLQKKNDQNLFRYCQKSRRLKISKALKLNVRNAINEQFKGGKLKYQTYNS